MTTRSDVTCRLLLFGTPKFEGPTGTADLPETAPAHLIAYLAAQTQWVSRESVAAYLWPNLPNERAQHNLRVALNRAGALLEPWQLKSALLAERRRVRLDLATDLAAFRTALAAGEWLQACALVTAPLFDQVQCTAYPALAEWMAIERESVRRAWRKALIEANQTGDLAYDALERYLAHHPSDAEIATLLVTRLVAAGQAAQARDALVAFRAAAGEELAAADLEAVARQIERAAEGAAPGAATWDSAGVVGRDDALQALDAAVAGNRLVTVTGLPGAGKSSLARAWLGRQSGAQAFVPVAARTTAAAALERVISGLTGQRSAHGSRDQSLRALEAVHGIVVLDGIDQAPADAGLLELVRLLQPMSGLRLLITARRPLGLDGERVQTIAGLSTVSSNGAPSAAAHLFLREVHRLRFDAPPGVEAAAERIAQASGGLPLALKLSAGWSRWLSPEDIVREFERSVRSDRGIDPSLRTLVQSTWQRLSDEQREAIEALSILPGAFDMLSAIEVAATSAATIEALSGAGLIEWRDDPQRPVWLLHALIRAHGQERLRGAPAMHRRVVTRYVSWLGHRLGRPHVVEGQPLFDAAAVTPLIDEVVQGWALAIETGDAAAMLWLIGALVSWHEAKGEFELALQRLLPALEALDESMPAEAATLTALQVARASLTYRASDFEVAARLGLDAHRLATRTGQAGLNRLSLNIVGLSRWMQARLPEAQAALEQALASAVASDNLGALRRLEGNLALLEKAQGRYAAAEARWRRGLDLAMTEQVWGAAVSYLNNLGNLLRQQGRLDECEPLALEALRLCQQHGLDGIRPFALIGLALLHAAKGRRDTAREYLDLVDSFDSASLESTVEAGAAQLRATLALEEGAYDQVRDHIVRALHICQRHDDGANRAEALEIHGRWLWSQGRPGEAEALWRSLLKAPSTSAILRDQLTARMQAHGLDVDGPTADTALVVERLLSGR